MSKCITCEEQKRIFEEDLKKSLNKEKKEENFDLLIKAEIKRFIEDKKQSYKSNGNFSSKFNPKQIDNYNITINNSQLYSMIIYIKTGIKYIGIVYLKNANKPETVGLALKDSSMNLGIPYLETKYYNQPLTYNSNYQTF